MTTPPLHQFDAGLDAFEELRAYVEHFCADAGIDQRTLAVLILICEELFENSRLHGYQAAAAASAGQLVWLGLAVAGDCIDMVYEDAAPAYNPFAHASAPDYSGPAETWKVGGLGIPLIMQLTRDLHYEHTGERNRTRLSVPLAAA